MKLLRLKADGFGPLKGEFTFDPERLTLVVDDNERGKSSLLAAICAGLYGLETDRRSFKVITPAERWRPWAGGSYRIELEVEANGERYTVQRDFDRATVAVFDGRGKDVTEKFRAGKDDYPVGKVLFGLDGAEFEKCALLRQGELAEVVSSDEKTRRHSTLHARLENAADTRVGDTNATEAVQVLQGATANYTSEELGSTMKVESALQKLEGKRDFLESELAALAHDLDQLQKPLEELSNLGEEETSVRQALDQLDAERRVGLALELRRKLDEDFEHRTEYGVLEAEAARLKGAGALPPSAENDLREAVARHEEMRKKLEGLDQRRREEQSRERTRVEAELEGMKSYAGCTAEDADRFIGLASELRRISDEDERLRTETFQLRDTLASRGHLPERIQSLTQRFEGLTGEQERMIRGQSEIALQYQTEVAQLEHTRTAATEILREIDALRHGRRLPGWGLTALGGGMAVAGFVLMALKTQLGLWSLILAVGALCMMIGVPLLMSGASAKAHEREEALRRLADAQRRLNQLRQQRAESEVSVNELSRGMGYRDPVELLKDWHEYSRITDESSPVMRAQNQMAALKEQRTAAITEVKALLAKVGGGSPEPAFLERAAHSIRLCLAGAKQLEEIDRGWGWIEEEKRVTEAQASGLRERAIKVLDSAKIPYDPARSWADYVRQIGELARGGQRLEVLTRELIPQAERRLLDTKSVEDLKGQLGALESVGVTANGASTRPQADLEAQTTVLRAQLDSVTQRRQDLRVQVEDVWRKHHTAQGEKGAELERVRAALEHARRFLRAATIATETIQTVAVETHRKWADHLNERVRDLLRKFGTGVEHVRFGEDLDFSVKLVDGAQATRGRATAQMSAGARDQLHLAIRLAVSEYLSRGQAPLPLLVDDAFATSDDERARAGMKLLIEHFAEQHQIILVTCHRQRHERLAALDPQLWAERVRVIDLGAAVKQG